MYLSGQLHALKTNIFIIEFLIFSELYWKEITTERLSASSVGGQRSGRTEVQTLCIPWIINWENPVMVPALQFILSSLLCHALVSLIDMTTVCFQRKQFGKKFVIKLIQYFWFFPQNKTIIINSFPTKISKGRIQKRPGKFLTFFKTLPLPDIIFWFPLRSVRILW